MFKFSLFILFAFIIFSCTKNTTPSKQRPSDEKITAYSEDISMFIPKYEHGEKIKETDAPIKKHEETKVNISKIISDNEAVDLILSKKTEINIQTKDSQGYRIQLFSGNNKSEFETTKTYLLKYFSELEIYESYSQPTYKIKVGDFLMRSEAEKYYGNLKSRFATIRIITDKINIKKALEIK